VVFCLLLLSFWPTLVSFPGTWNASYREHGFVVAGLIAWLIWRDRRLIVDGAGRPLPDLIPLVGLASLAWMLAIVIKVGAGHQLLFGVVITGWALAVFGWAARRTVVGLGATFLLALPVWELLMPGLQRATTIASGAATRLVGITAEIGYDYITISSGTFLVEEGCSGINYLLGGLVLGAFYAHLFVDRWQTQLKIVALAGGVSILGNWIRVSVLIFIGEATAMQSPMIEDHLWQGWLIFMLLMIPTYFLAEKLEARDRVGSTAPPQEEASRAAPPAEEDHSGSVSGPAPVPLRPALNAGFAAVVGPILLVTIGLIPKGSVTERGPEVLGLADSWTAAEAPADTAAWGPDFRGIDDHAAWVVRGDLGLVEAARYYFIDQRQGEELIQWGNAIAPDSLTGSDRVLGPIGPRRRFLRQTIVRDGDASRLVWYWYRVAGYDTPFPSKAKLLEVLAFVRRTPAAELITLSARCGPESCLEAARTVSAAVGGPPIEEPPPEVDSLAPPEDSIGGVDGSAAADPSG
jgi:exosortase